MWSVLPKLEAYKQFRREGVRCLTGGGILTYKIRVTDGKSSTLMALITVLLIDEEGLDSDESAHTKFHQRELPKHQQIHEVHKSTLGAGETPTVVGTLPSDNRSIGKFIRLFRATTILRPSLACPIRA